MNGPELSSIFKCVNPLIREFDKIIDNDSKGTYRILYIEDDNDDSDYFRMELSKSKRANFIIDCASSIEDVFLKELNIYDVFIVDYRLPTIDGITLMKSIKNKNNIDKPFVILTGMGSEDVDREALASGAYDYLVKEKIDQEILERTILYCYEKYKLIKNAQRKSLILEMVLDSIHAAVFLLNKNGKVIISNRQAKSLFNFNATGHNFDEIINFYPYSDDVFNLELKGKVKLSEKIDELKNLPKIYQGVIRSTDGSLISCIISMDVIRRGEKAYKMISVIDNSIDHKEKQMLIRENRKLESNLKKYGIEKNNPNPIIDLVDNEIDRFLNLEETNGSY